MEIAGLAAAMSKRTTSHPIADAIRRYAEERGAPCLPVEASSEAYRIGLGLEAKVGGHRVCIGNPRMMREAGIDPKMGEAARDDLASRGISSVLVAVDGELACVIGYADAPRPESARIVRELKANGRRRIPASLSGDARAPVEAIARIVGIDEAIADVLPENKADVVRRLKSEGRKVAMVGDGINDAPALAVADVGISLHGGEGRRSLRRSRRPDVWSLLEGGLERLPCRVSACVGRARWRASNRCSGSCSSPTLRPFVAGAFGLINPVMAATVNNGSTIAAAMHAILPLLRRTEAPRASRRARSGARRSVEDDATYHVRPEGLVLPLAGVRERSGRARRASTARSLLNTSRSRSR